LIAAISLIALFLFYKELKLFTVDPNYAQTIGMPVKVMHYGVLLFLSFTVVVGIQAVGTVLTNALLVIPVAAARLLTDRWFGPEWFSGGVFIGAGPWFHGPDHFYGHVDHH